MIARFAQTRDRGNERTGTGGQYHRSRRAEPPDGAVGGLDLDGPLPGQASGAADKVDALALQPRQLPVVPPVSGHVVALGERGCAVQVAGDSLGGSWRAPGRGQHVARPDKRLRRDAAPVGALATDQLFFHDGGAEAAVGHPASGVFTGRARADHHHIV